MVDKISRERRSENMRRIRSKDTNPEMVVRRHVHAAGLRYRLHVKGLPGKPDLVFPGRRLCVFVHGCFWHGCPKCVDGTRTVKSNSDFWRNKVEGNRSRDQRHREALHATGWDVITLWECETKSQASLEALTTAIRDRATLRPRERDRRQELPADGSADAA